MYQEEALFMFYVVLTAVKCQKKKKKEKVNPRLGNKRNKIKKNWAKHTKNREVSRRVSRELREDSAMLLNAWKSTGSDFFFPFCVSPVSKSTWKLFWGTEQVELDCERKWGRAGHSSSLFLYPLHRSWDLRGPKAQWPRTPVKDPWGGVEVETRGWSTIDKFYNSYSSLFLSFCLDVNRVNHILRTSYSSVKQFNSNKNWFQYQLYRIRIDWKAILTQSRFFSSLSFNIIDQKRQGTFESSLIWEQPQTVSIIETGSEERSQFPINNVYGSNHQEIRSREDLSANPFRTP